MVAKLCIYLIEIYQVVLSRLLPNACRFYPSCSQYALDAIRKYGFWKGSYRSMRRILRCHPFHPGGYDPA
jgi:uncharacterized protein